jgi:predicted RecB family nuclease
MRISGARVMATKITRDVLESYLDCKYKAHLKVAGHQGSKSDYETLLGELRDAVRIKATDKVLARYQDHEIERGVVLTPAVLRGGAAFVLEAALEDEHASLAIDGLMRVAGPSRLGPFHYIPVLFSESEKVRKAHRLVLDVLAHFLTRLQGRMPGNGIVWHGKECRATKVRLGVDPRKTERLLEEIRQTTALGQAPLLVLNDHCRVCEFQQRCADQAKGEDNVSLLRGMSEKEVRKQIRKGIFTVTQLSCTFHPRRSSRRAGRSVQPHYHALQALAVREKKVHVLGTPLLPSKRTDVYFDIEGDSDGSFAYLLGVIVVSGETEERYSFWADDERQEQQAFSQLLEKLRDYGEFSLYHYGGYESAFLRRMRRSGSDTKFVDELMACSVNVLSLVHSHVYFPTYSNGLKEVGGYLDCQWTDHAASGIRAMVWRRQWEENRDAEIKQKLLDYNLEDCSALRRVTEFIRGLDRSVDSPGRQNDMSGVARVEDIGGHLGRPERFDRKLSSDDFDYINQCAYFDYQREKVFVRTNERIRHVHGKKQPRTQRVKANRRVEIRCVKCIFCKGTDIRRKAMTHSKLEYDLKFTDGSIRRMVTAHVAAQHWCRNCRRQFLPPRYKRRVKRHKYGHSLASWVVYQHVANSMSFPKIWATLKDCFGLRIPFAEVHMLKAQLARYYRPTYELLLRSIPKGKLLHADETSVRLRRTKGYVWVFTNMEEVAYFYKPTREGDFLHEMLSGFKGVLVTDFYSAYDSIDCPQQKCLIHLMRDLNDDLLGSPYDEEYKTLVGEFGQLLRRIVESIDRYGLKRRYLHAHKAKVDRFFDMIAKRSYKSDLAGQYQKRFLRYRGKLFTFLEYDGVPWNNNNAEHAVKTFANYREIADGRMTEGGIDDYLVLLSIYQTCKYKGISFLKFLLSRDKDLSEFCSGTRGRRTASPDDVYAGGYPRLYRKARRASADRAE